ncbi:right-handed parallel beta-helix repeat-containing protein [Eubacteriales bacterium OttesenSCG-928-A19]|nr:right-handed parallel beta-helix repeat-containing protein [Eubacteriales bacterium OttesenSCG-928-A19]
MKHLSLITLLVIFCALVSLSAAEDAETYFFFSESSSSDATTSLEANLYVAPYGNDDSNGSLDAPLRTLWGAVSRVIEEMPVQKVNIWLREGTYFLHETLRITGEINTEISFRAYENETPVITGAQHIETWTEAVYGNGGRIWSTQVNAQSIRALYGESGSRQNARWPKSGMLLVAGTERRSSDKFEKHYGFFAATENVPSSLQGAVVRLLHWWKDELSGVKQYDPQTGFVLMNRPTSMAIETGDLYWFENVLSMPLAEGEWAFDASTQTLYYVPWEAETIENTPLYVGITECLIQVSGVPGITFDGIAFARTGWQITGYDTIPDFQQAAYDAGAAIHVSNSKKASFTSCIFQDIGAGAIRFDENVKDAGVYGCTFSDIGAQAVYIHGQNSSVETMITERISIDNNEIVGYGRNFYNAAAILIVHARNVDVRHNEIHDGTYTAISAGWVWGTEFNITDYIRIENNLVYDIGQGLLSDMGAIYLLGAQPNTVITGNIVHDVNSYDYGGWGIYLDEGTSGIQVTNNLVYRCSAQGFHQHIGNGNTVRNNIFALNGDGQVGISGKGSFLLERNIVYGARPYLNITNDTGTIRNRNNLFRTQMSPFVDAENGDFTLVDNTAMNEIDFEPWVFIAGRRNVF